MKRDGDLVKEIMGVLENSDELVVGPRDVVANLQSEYAQKEIEYHIGLLLDAGFIRQVKSSDFSEAGGTKNQGLALTWMGHDCIEAEDSGGWEISKKSDGDGKEKRESRIM